jgi:hypothetical protein
MRLRPDQLEKKRRPNESRFVRQKISTFLGCAAQQGLVEKQRSGAPRPWQPSSTRSLFGTRRHTRSCSWTRIRHRPGQEAGAVRLVVTGLLEVEEAVAAAVVAAAEESEAEAEVGMVNIGMAGKQPRRTTRPPILSLHLASPIQASSTSRSSATPGTISKRSSAFHTCPPSARTRPQHRNKTMRSSHPPPSMRKTRLERKASKIKCQAPSMLNPHQNDATHSPQS